jgi:glycosyltransferase involved in cell wall biosynthesis
MPSVSPQPPEPRSTTARVATISVIVPSWRRPADLARCLRALAAQRVAPFEVIVGARAGDDETEATVAAAAERSAFPVRIERTSEPGVIAAMNAALTHARGDIVALTDDDAEPRPDWLERLNDCFIIPFVGAAGGRDWQPKERGDRHDVGRVQWFGRVIGNHHLGAGPARPVDVLKGVNLALRTSLLKALGFDTRLRGAGAQMFWELALCLPLRRAGWTLIYDPAIAVDHHIAERHDADQRHRDGGVFVAAAQRDAVHNETLVMLEHLRGGRRFAYLVWAILFGTRIEPGLAQVPRLLLTGAPSVFGKFFATMAGRRDGWRALRAMGSDASTRLPIPPRSP